MGNSKIRIFSGVAFSGFILVLLFSFSQPAAAQNENVLFIVAPENFRDEELFVPKEILERAGKKVEVASTKTGRISGMLKGNAVAGKLIENSKPEDYSALVIVGGTGSKEFLWESGQLRNLVVSFAKLNRPLAAICLSPVVLGKAGVLKGKKATVWKDDETLAELKKAGAAYEEKPVVSDGMIITGNGPEAAKAFAEAILKALKK